ncbi:MAG: RNA pyrophosphohydrolase [Hyphomicrobiales bacterium]
MNDTDTLNLPYRANVGIALFNRLGQVWVGRRAGMPETLPEEDDMSFAWQMPQGGIDEGEDPLPAAKRELFEETNVTSIELLAEAVDWFTYELAPDIIKKGWRSKYRGQRQKWFAFLFTGDEGEINVLTPGGGKFDAEFSQWRWVDLKETPDMIVPFKREVYEQVVGEFSDTADNLKLD